MQARLRQQIQQRIKNLDIIVEKYALLILGAILAFTTYQKWQLIIHTDGGGDLLGADIPKSMMLTAGQNPYVSNPWASPYPPFLLAVVGSIIRATSGTVVLSPDAIGEISRNVRTVGLVADATVAIMIFLALRARSYSGISAVVPAAIYLALPSISLSPYFWFNSDVFGYPILGASILALIKSRYLVGSVLLSTATIFKIQPILAIPLVIFWLVRKNGMFKTLPTIFSTTVILSLGLVAPVLLPGYLASILGFNLSSGFGAGTSSFTMMNLFYTAFPAILGVSFPMIVENQVWLAVTGTLFMIALGFVWKRARCMSPVDVVTIGLLVWLIPLRQIYTHYLVWAIVPFLMRGRLSQALLVGSLLELANTMASWSWDLPPDPFPILATPIGFLATSIVYFSVSATALFFSLRLPKASEQLVARSEPVTNSRKYAVPITGFR
jgi:hypothetical protein